jgi:DNA polymerase III delta prime subunit
MKLHYDPAYIQDNGEIRAHIGITDELKYVDEEWHLIHSLRISGKYHRGQKAGECDFVLVSKWGIMIVEVKGAKIILEENSLFQLKASTGARRRIRPFSQVEDNASGMEEFLKDNNLPFTFIGRVVLFPECEFRYSGISYEILWHMGSKQSMFSFIRAELLRQKEEYREKTLARLYHALERDPENEDIRRRIERTGTAFPNLRSNELDQLLKALLPKVVGEDSRNRYIVSRENAQSYSEINQAFLMGLHRNPRLMVQGPPGCGKSTYALELIRRQAEKEEETGTGLFLCWNEFLACSIRHRIENDEEIPVEMDVFPFYGYVQLLINDAGLPPDTLEYANIHEIALHLKAALDLLASMNRLPGYSFIVVDEAQDLFDRGLEQILDRCQAVDKGIEKGTYYVFYDNTQAYTRRMDISQYNFVQDYLHDQSASFIMPVRFRTFGDTGISDFVDDIQQGIFDLKKSYGDNVELLGVRRNRVAEILGRKMERLVRETDCSAGDMVLLCSSNLEEWVENGLDGFIKLDH